ncbi:MAG: hypothetical protein K9G46_03310 [Flavobacteriales bacterium]|jgi:hypothetical protein|nr:hypothetical protein [Flavobacteriales bacterium]
MKTQIFFSIIALVMAGCNSDSIVAEDYRDAFVGTYIGTRTNSSWSLNGPSTSNEIADTIEVFAVADSMVTLDATEIIISTYGEFYEQGGSGASSYFSVQFLNGDSLITEMNGGGLGGGYHSTFKGKK